MAVYKIQKYGVLEEFIEDHPPERQILLYLDAALLAHFIGVISYRPWPVLAGHFFGERFIAHPTWRQEHVGFQLFGVLDDYDRHLQLLRYEAPVYLGVGLYGEGGSAFVGDAQLFEHISTRLASRRKQWLTWSLLTDFAEPPGEGPTDRS